MRRTLAELELAQGYVLVAPVAGRVAALQAETGQAAAPEVPLVAIVPEDAGMEVQLLLPSRASGLVEVGQAVRLRIDAFPFQRFGSVNGTVAQVGRATYRPGDLLTPIVFAEAVYRVTVMPERLSVSAYGEERRLQAGMTLSADIVVDRRRFIDVLLDPLRAIRGPAA
ncbi:HlyD family efflux transporter periplasmic adaptor subunit [Niveispirillum fermenti]|uniref:HlyD family efflux transporter periplasmic adaptor subunit n=1 Tax=Niveispirillum fermenti TaxID=1233113 RepID=UPI003A8481EF